MTKEGYRGAEKVLAWSFYTQGVTDGIVSAELFVDYALRFFRDPTPTEGLAWEKGERLAHLIRAQRTLLIIDGLEPLQYPPGPNEGALKDKSLVALFRELASANKGLCIVTSRLPITDIEQFQTSTCKIKLAQLHPRNGAALLKSCDVI